MKYKRHYRITQPDFSVGTRMSLPGWNCNSRQGLIQPWIDWVSFKGKRDSGKGWIGWRRRGGGVKEGLWQSRTLAVLPWSLVIWLTCPSCNLSNQATRPFSANVLDSTSLLQCSCSRLQSPRLSFNSARLSDFTFHRKAEGIKQISL